MATERMALLDESRPAVGEGDRDFLREGVKVVA